MIEKLKILKEKIIKGTTSEMDVDTINDVIALVYKIEERAAHIQEVPQQEEFCLEPLTGVNVSIKNATIHIHLSEKI